MKIGIIGLGLIGGSLFKDLSKNYDVIAVSQSQQGERIFKNYDVLKDREIIFVCTPMNKTLKVLDELENYLSPETIVTDVCSLKEFVCKKERPYIFIPSHPMAGTEHKGFENSFEGLFKGAKWVVIEEAKNSGKLKVESGKLLLEKIINYLGAEPVYTTAEEHDKAVALISHMPMVLAQALVLNIKDNPLAKEIAASGFRDMTRLALSNEEMACDMVSMNSKNIEQAILNLYKSVGELTNGNYPEIIKELKQIRSKMY
ncbi:prephenate dehydrogenase/arogenate dehydrogenase family protein [bacterium]|nr:prephenate dehydrogenase/arogenate dehydrogenase family protein [bacterium]